MHARLALSNLAGTIQVALIIHASAVLQVAPTSVLQVAPELVTYESRYILATVEATPALRAHALRCFLQDSTLCADFWF